MFMLNAREDPRTVRAVTLTPIVEAVIVVVVLVVVLQGRGAAGAQLCQSAAGGRELGAEVGHFLTGRLDGPINALCQMFVVLHHFKDFPLRTESTQSSMMSSGALERVKQRPFFSSSPPCPLLFPLFSSSSSTCAPSLTVYFAHIYISMKAPVPLLFSAEKLRDDLSSLEACRITHTHTRTQKSCVCVRACEWRAKERESEREEEKNAKKGESGEREEREERGEAAQRAEGKVSAPAEENVL